MTAYAHTLDGRPESEWEPLAEHLEAVGTLAAAKGEAAGLADWARLAGLLHDLGKTSAEFQARLRGDLAKVDHSTAGALEAVNRWGQPAGKLLAYAIAGHHAGLPNGGKLNDRLRDTALPAYDGDFVALPETPPAVPFAFADPDLGLSLLVRMVFSCLVDADFVATEQFHDPAKSERRGRSIALAALIEPLEAELRRKAAGPDSPLNADRRAIQDACRDAAAWDPGLFSLTVPTGGGKTLASLLFALHHARAHGLRRVIYAIPYTSIIEQTAAVFREVLGDDAVLEHHSSHPYPTEDGDKTRADKVPEEDDAGRRAYEKTKLDAENWDAPVVVTTNVQFFESLFADRPARCRKLQAVAGSVVVLDEAQMLPIGYLRPCIAALRELAANYRVSPVLCTATQPALDESEWLEKGLDGVREIAPDPDALHERFRRVEVREAGELDTDALADALAARDQALCILDTRGEAATVFKALRDRAPEGSFHLSARMCPAHRRARLAEIRQRLNDGLPCRVVSTQLVEAGVDVDFPEVFRALAGLDSLAQAAGRCNREARAARGTLHVFTNGRKNNMPDWRRRIDCARPLLDRDPLSPAAQRRFFQELYDLADLDPKNILDLLFTKWRKPSIDFAEAAARFKFIQDAMEPVIVDYRGPDGDDDTARQRIDALRWSESPGALARGLDPYVVQLHPREIAALAKDCMIERLHPDDKERGGYLVLVNDSLYDDDLGLCPEDPTYLAIDTTMI